MRGIVERESRPDVVRILRVARVVHERLGQSVQTIVMTCGTVRDVPRVHRAVKLPGIRLIVVHRRIALVGVDMTAEDQVYRVLQKDGFEDIFALSADRGALVLVGYVPRSVAGDDDPGSLGAVDCRKVGGEPLRLLVAEGGERSRVLGLTSAWLIGGDKAVSEIGLCVEADEVSHAVVVAVPEVLETARRSRRHTEVVPVSGEVGLARHADTDIIGEVVSLVRRTAVVAIGFVVARAYHVGFVAGNGGHLVIELVQNPFVNGGTLRKRRVGYVAANLLLQPVVRIRNVASMHEELVRLLVVLKTLNSIALTRYKRVGGTLADGGGETTPSHGPQIHNDSDDKRLVVARNPGSCEVVDLRMARRQAEVVGRVWAQIRELDMVVVCRRRLIRDGLVAPDKLCEVLRLPDMVSFGV